MGTSWQRVATALLAFVVVVPLAVFAWLSVTTEDTPDRVRLSVDGVRWSAELEDAFFYSDEPWAPGEVRTAILWVRNDAPVPADVTVTVICEKGDVLVDHGALVVSGAVDDGRPQRFDPDEYHNDVRVMTLKPAESTTLTLRAELVSDIPDAQVIDSKGVRYRVVGSGHALEDGSTSVANARLVLAPVFIGLALIVSAVFLGSRGSSLSRPRRPE